VLVLAVVEDRNNANTGFQRVRVQFVGTEEEAQIMIQADRAQVDQVLWVLGDKKNPDLPSLAFTENEWTAWVSGLVGEFVAALAPPANMTEAYKRATDLDLTEVEAAVLKEHDLTPEAASSIMDKYRRHLALVAFSPTGIAVLDHEVDWCVHAHVALPASWRRDMMQITGSVVFHVPCGEDNPADPAAVERTVHLYEQLEELAPA
jgi:hypothetical protein